MADSSRLCSVFLGSETGILKGVSLSRKQAFNFCNTQHLSRDQEVRVLVWGDRAETDLLLGARDGSVKTFSLEKGSFTETRSCGDPQEGGFTGLEVLEEGGLVTCQETGTIRVWRESSSDPVAEVITGKNVSRMRQNPAQRNKMATGGKENGLKIWDLENPKNPPVFSAKNLKDDWLDLKRAQWVRDIAFIPQSEKVVTCTGYHQVHIHDPSSPQRRPVMEMEFGDHPLTALSLPTGGTSVVVGNTRGEVAVLDLRKGLVRGVLKGLCGGVRALQCHPSFPIVASCGLDRFLRIHSLEDRKLQHKVYLKSRLNCLLLASQREEWGGGAGAGGEEVKKEEEEEEEEDEVWENMERVEEQGKRKSTTEEEEEEETLKKKKSKKGED
ncbi:WD repeat-containing protein 74 [Dissostichus eleginoides]|uniref:WD repeat-containing protein 74 n=1 Tax=Dissostichus eleginoides TaxID=100907 RepID=A0AAD9CFQ6_DISEL|nr:WD repeat-containing protein 74 [Dissostichus eleginoides]